MQHYSDIVGVTGSALLILAYFLLQAGKLKSNEKPYLYLNLTAAALIMVSLFFTPNIASIVIELFWIGISLYGIWRINREQK